MDSDVQGWVSRCSYCLAVCAPSTRLPHLHLSASCPFHPLPSPNSHILAGSAEKGKLIWVTINSGTEKTVDGVEHWNFPFSVHPTPPLLLRKTLTFLGVTWFAQGHNKLAAKMELEQKSLFQFFHEFW